MGQMVQMEFLIDKQAECGGVELIMEREGVVDGEEECTAIMSSHHSVLEKLQRRLEQMIQTESIVNDKDECSWLECEHQQEWSSQWSVRFGQSHSIRTSSLN
jgi:hypothetical protein